MSRADAYVDDLFRQLLLKNGLEIEKNLKPGQKNVLAKSELQDTELAQYADVMTGLVVSEFLFAMAFYSAVQANFAVQDGPLVFCTALVASRLIRLLQLHSFAVDEELENSLMVWTSQITERLYDMQNVHLWISNVSVSSDSAFSQSLVSVLTRTSLVAVQTRMRQDELFRNTVLRAMQQLKELFATSYPSV
jgi:hypothetical protein